MKLRDLLEIKERLDREAVSGRVLVATKTQVDELFKEMSDTNYIPAPGTTDRLLGFRIARIREPIEAFVDDRLGDSSYMAVKCGLGIVMICRTCGRESR